MWNVWENLCFLKTLIQSWSIISSWKQNLKPIYAQAKNPINALNYNKQKSFGATLFLCEDLNCQIEEYLLTKSSLLRKIPVFLSFLLSIQLIINQ